MKKVCIIGLGYIGLPTAALLANRGYDVHGVDIVQSIVDTINQGKIHIVEPELDTFVQAAVRSKRLKADTKPTKADIFIIAVPTPFKDNFIPNIDYVINATKSIAPYVEEGDLVLYVNSFGLLEIGVNTGNAAKVLGVRLGDDVCLKLST